MPALDFLSQLVVSGAISASLTLALVWLSKSWVSERLKNAIKHEYDEKLEAHKAHLHAQSAIETERLRSQLTIQSTEHAVRFARLHEKRAEVIAELYSRLVESYLKASSFANPVEWAGEPDKIEKYREAWGAFADFFRYFEKNRIYLPQALCEQIEGFVRGMREKVIGFGVLLTDAGEVRDQEFRRERFEAWESCSEYMEKVVPPARIALEGELRLILGAAAAG